MLIDWPTTFFQIVNFLVLIFILKRFLYAPILRAMEEREKRIATAITRAREAEEEANQLTLNLKREKQTLDDAKGDLMEKAKEEVNEWREKALNVAKGDVDSQKTIWMDGLSRDRHAFLANLKKNIAQQVILIGEKVLQDLASDDLERQIVRVFLKKVDRANAMKEPEDISTEILIKSGFVLKDDISTELRSQLAVFFPKALNFRFEVDRGIGVGIQVMANNLKIGWNLKEYLGGLEKEILQELFSHGREET